MNLQGKFMEENIKIEGVIFNIYETSYDNDTYWVDYKVDMDLGCEIIKKDELDKYKVGGVIITKEKPSITVFSEILQEFIKDCYSSSNDVFYCEEEDIEADVLLKIEEEIIALDKKYKDLQLSKFIKFGDFDIAITIYREVCSKFLF